MTAVPAAPPFTPMAVGTLLERVLLGFLTALIVSRPLVAGDDPGRLRLTTSGAELTFNLGVFVLFCLTAARRVLFDRGRAVAFEIVPLTLVGVGFVCYLSSQQGDRYARPGLFHAWEWYVLGAMFYIVRRIAPAARETRGLINVLLASAASIAVVGVYQALEEPLGLPTSFVPTGRTDLVGNDEFYPELNRQFAPSGPKGTFDRPETMAVSMLAWLPLSIVIARAGWRANRQHKIAVFVPLLLGAACILGVSVTVWHPNAVGTAWTLWREHWLWGVGPGNYSRRTPTNIPHAGGAWPLLTATTGVLAVVLVVATGALVARAVRRPVRVEEAPIGGVRWDFYYGGIVGLLLGFVWSTFAIPVEASSDEVIRLGMVAVGRAIVWFAVFGLLEKIAVPLAWLSWGLRLGIVFVVLAGFVGEAVLLPTVLLPVVVACALLMNLHPEPALVGPRWSQLLAVVVVLNAVVFFVLYLLSAAVPGWATANAVRDARLASLAFAEKDRDIELSQNRVDRANNLTAARNYLRGAITLPLREALRQDPHNAALMLEIAHWQRPLYRYQTHADPKAAATVAKDNLRLGDAAGKLDPHNLSGQRSLYESLVTFQQEAGVNVLPAERLKAVNERIRLIALREPHNEVALRYRMVQALFDGGDRTGLTTELGHLLRLANVEGTPHGALTSEQRQLLRTRTLRTLSWLRIPPEMWEELLAHDTAR